MNYYYYFFASLKSIKQTSFLDSFAFANLCHRLLSVLSNMYEVTFIVMASNFKDT